MARAARSPFTPITIRSG